jgi:hypothetical protein
MQQEMPFLYPLPQPQWVQQAVLKGWTSWREAVLWCWENRPDRGQGELGDQSMFRQLCKRQYGVDCHAPHISRWFNRRTKAPMDLPVDLKPAFEVFTGWRGLTQYAARLSDVTIFEEMAWRAKA